MKSVISEAAQGFCPGVFSKDIFFLCISDWVCFDRRIADCLYFLCVYQHVFYMLTLQNYKSQNKQITNSRVYINLGWLVAAVPTERSITFQSLAWAKGIHWEEKYPSFPTDNCGGLKAWDWIALIMVTVCRRLEVIWGYGKQFSFLPLWAYPKGIDFFLSLYRGQRLSLKCWIKAHRLENCLVLCRRLQTWAVPQHPLGYFQFSYP